MDVGSRHVAVDWPNRYRVRRGTPVLDPAGRPTVYQCPETHAGCQSVTSGGETGTGCFQIAARYWPGSMVLNRRQFVATVVAASSAVATAGCSDDGEFEEGSSGDSNDADTGDSGGGSGGGGNGDGDTGDGSGGGSSSDIELLSHEMVREDEGSMAESVTVEGEAENVSGSELSYAEVEVKFYEGETLAESFLDNINNLSAGETWAFDVQFPGIGEDAAAVTDYEIRAGTSL